MQDGEQAPGTLGAAASAMPNEGLLRLRRIIGAPAHDGPFADDELVRLIKHISDAGFDPVPQASAGGRLAGVVWNGRVLRGRDRLTSAEVHYLRHVTDGQEWPSGVSLAQYLQSAREVVLDPRSAVFLSRYLGLWQITVVRTSDDLRGPRGNGWVRVEFRIDLGRWVTVFQSDDDPLSIEQSPNRSEQQWLRRPQ